MKRRFLVTLAAGLLAACQPAVAAESVVRRARRRNARPTSPPGSRPRSSPAAASGASRRVFSHIRGRDQRGLGLSRRHARATANYDQVCGGDTGHAEAVRVTYDPSSVRYDQLLQVLLLGRSPTRPSSTARAPTSARSTAPRWCR